MTNTPSLAREWTEFVAARPEFKCGELLLQQFSAGDVTRLCDCGCNSYDFKLHAGAGLPSLVPPSENAGCAFELDFQTEEWGNTVSFSVFVDRDGNLSGIDVHYCANTSPMPENPRLAEPPFHAYGLLAHEAQPCGQPDLAHKAAQGRIPSTLGDTAMSTPDLDLAPLLGCDLVSIGVCLSHLELRFGSLSPRAKRGECRIDIESDFELRIASQSSVICDSQANLHQFTPSLFPLIGRSVVDSAWTGDRCLLLKFSDGEQLVLRPDPTGLESYHVHTPTGSIDV